jgi:uncharacterized protein (TIGR02001 family)
VLWRVICTTVALIVDCEMVCADVSSTPPAFNGELGVYSNYVGRGLTFSNDRPVFQGRVEYESRQQFYSGVVVTDTADILDEQTAEVDLYAGYRAQLADFAIDVGTVSWLFPGGHFDVSNNTYNMVEAVVDVTYKVVGLRLWYDVGNYLGLDSASAAVNYGVLPNGSSRGSSYVDLHLTVPLSRSLCVKLHAGRQLMRNYAELNYTDWEGAIEQMMGHGVTFGVAYTDTDANKALYVGPTGKLLGRSKLLLYIRWAFPGG